MRELRLLFNRIIPGRLLTRYTGTRPLTGHKATTPHLCLENRQAGEPTGLRSQLKAARGRYLVQRNHQPGSQNPREGFMLASRRIFDYWTTYPQTAPVVGKGPEGHRRYPTDSCGWPAVLVFDTSFHGDRSFALTQFR